MADALQAALEVALHHESAHILGPRAECRLIVRQSLAAPGRRYSPPGHEILHPLFAQVPVVDGSTRKI
eukprot:589801-Pyramimonas_sp.AAC.1